MKRFKKPKGAASPYSRADSLNCVPVKSRQIREIRLDSGEIQVAYPVTMRPLLAAMLRKLGRPPAELPLRRLQLDELGTCVWEMLDGQRTVDEIVKSFAGRHSLQRREAELAVSAFLRELGRRGIIGLRQAAAGAVCKAVDGE